MAMGVILLIAGLFWFVRKQRNESLTLAKQPVPRLPLVNDRGDSLKESPATEVSQHFTLWQPLANLQKKPEIPNQTKPAPSEPLPKLIHDFELVQKISPKEQLAKPANHLVPSIPFGSVIPCRLLQAVQCGQNAVPVIAELLQSVKDSKGQNWIPRGTRIHGSVNSGSLPGRIESAGEWIFVLPGQKLLETKASLQDRDFDSVLSLYGINDGTAGILGTIAQVKKSDWKQTVFREGVAIAADAAQDRARTALGEIELGSARNAALRSVSSLVKGVSPTDSQQSSESYVSVPAGKEFYLYINDKAQNQPVARTSEMETMLRERGLLVEQLRQQMGRTTP
jgi:Bacterial conjugation TrbI-like protein